MIKKIRLTGSVANLPRSGRPRKLFVEALIDQQMCKADEMTTTKIQKKLSKRGISVSSSTVQRSRKQRTTYCQLIRDTNQVKQLEFAQCLLESGDAFHNMIFSNECSISLQSYCSTCVDDGRAINSHLEISRVYKISSIFKKTIVQL